MRNIFVVLFVLVFSISAQSYMSDSTINIDLVKVKNANLYTVLDNLILNVQKCEYFTKECMFFIDIQSYSKDTSIVTIDISDELTNNDLANSVGCFIYKGYMILLSAENDSLFNTLFEATNRNKQFSLNPIDKHCEQLRIDDDRMPSYSYFLIGDEFFNESSYPPCPR